MGTLENIKQSRMQAMRVKDTKAKNILTVLLGDIQNMELRTGKAIADDQVVAMVKKYVANANETIAHASEDQAQALRDEIQILEYFLPIQMSELEIEKVIASCGAENMGQAMSHLKENFAGKYDGKMASQVVKRLLV